MAQRAGLLGPGLGLEGVVSNYAVSDQAGERVLQFLVNADGAQPVAVELRGERVSGVLADGHRVALVAPPDLESLDDRTLHPLKVKNLTTGGIVSVFRPGLRQKAFRAGVSTIKEGWKAIIGGIIAAALVALGVKGGTAATIENHARTARTLIVMEAIWLAVSTVIVYFTLYRRWRWEGGRFPVGAAVGIVVMGGILTAGLWWTWTAP